MIESRIAGLEEKNWFLRLFQRLGSHTERKSGRCLGRKCQMNVTFLPNSMRDSCHNKNMHDSQRAKLSIGSSLELRSSADSLDNIHIYSSNVQKILNFFLDLHENSWRKGMSNSLWANENFLRCTSYYSRICSLWHKRCNEGCKGRGLNREPIYVLCFEHLPSSIMANRYNLLTFPT